jgi:hypothetical protein
MKFVMDKSPHCGLIIEYKGEYIEETINIKFLRLELDNHLNWKNHIVQMIP